MSNIYKGTLGLIGNYTTGRSCKHRKRIRSFQQLSWQNLSTLTRQEA